MPQKSPPESSVPGGHLSGGRRRNQFWRGHGSPSVLNEVFSNLARLCASKSANGPRKNSFRPDSPLTTPSNRGRKTQSYPSPHRTWSVSDASSLPQLNLHLIENERNEDRLNSSGLHSAHLNIQFHINIKYKYICGRVRPRDERLVYTPHCPPAVPAASSPAYLKYFTPDSNIFISCSP